MDILFFAQIFTSLCNEKSKKINKNKTNSDHKISSCFPKYKTALIFLEAIKYFKTELK